MKRVLAFLLCAVLFVSLAACGKPEKKHASGGRTGAGTEPKDEGSASAPAFDPWNATPTVHEAKLPADALRSEREFAVAVAPDGVTYLLDDPEGAPSLYNSETKKRIALTPANAEAEAFMAFRAAAAYGLEAARVLKEKGEDSDLYKALTKKAEQAETLHGEALFRAFIEDPRSPFSPHVRIERPAALIDGNRLIIVVTSAYRLLLDCDTGALYCYELGDVLSGRGDELLFHKGPAPVYSVVDLKTGNVLREIGFSDAAPFENGASGGCASFLADGSVCALLYNAVPDFQTGTEAAIAVRTPDGKTEAYPIGKLRDPWSTGGILCAGTEQIFLFGTSVTTPVCLIDRTTGTAGFLSWKNGRIETVAPDKWPTGPDGRPSPQSDGLMILDSFADEKTVLAYVGAVSGYVLYKPETGEIRLLAMNEQFPNRFSWNRKTVMMTDKNRVLGITWAQN